MGIVSSRDRRKAEKRAERQAKARSDEIDLNIEQDSKSFKRQCDVLLISSCPHLVMYRQPLFTGISDCIYLSGIPESEAAASALIMRMKTLHDNGHPNDEPAQLTYKRLADLRPVIWKILLQNSRRIAMGIRSQNLRPVRRSNKVRFVFYTSPSFVVDGVFMQANCEYIMNHRIDTDSSEFSFLPKFGRAVQDLWAEEIIPMLLDHPSRLSVDDNAA
jgi:hypothetical protein